MCDLIDLNSPDRKGLLGQKLASPLIPVPMDTAHGNRSNHTNESSSLMTEKRDNLENNPFDMVLHKTTEYIQKRDDPFEVALEKALKTKHKKVALRTSSIDLTDNFILKHRRHIQILKMNRTLDDSSINEQLNSGTYQKEIPVSETFDSSITIDLNNTNMLDEDLKTNSANLLFSKNICKVPDIDIQNADSSILNQSIMNDTLFETSYGSDKDQMKSNLQQRISAPTYKNIIDAEQVMVTNAHLKVPKLRRSHSQGEKISPKKVQYLNRTSQSTMETLRRGSTCSSISSVSSLNSVNPLNEGFLKSQCSGSSVFSSLSNISAISKINSVSSTNSSLMLSNGTINRTFLESCSSEKGDSTRLNEQMDSIKETSFVLPTSTSSMSSAHNTVEKIRSSMSDLTDRFNKLKSRSSELHVPENSISEKTISMSSVSKNPKESAIETEKMNEEFNANNKLIDVDVFSPKENCGKEHYRSSISDTSSDSVFTEGSKINKSIFHEAKALARTFEELALKTSSGSSIDDLITSNPSWALELLPAFDDEAMVDNLIELPASPNTSNGNVNSKNDTNHTSHTNKNENCAGSNRTEDHIKELETELIEPIPMEKRITAATLLLDLKKLITTENNTEANKLLENLGKALGVECKNNTELLTTYLNTANNLAKSPEKPNAGLEIIKNVREDIEKSREDNLSINSMEIVKEPVSCENVNLNNLSISKSTENSQKCLKELNNESKNVTPTTDTSTNTSIEKINIETDKDKLNTANISEKSSDSICKVESNNLLNEKMAMELLTNLGKLLNGQAKEQPTLDLLTNLGKVLNFASNNYNVINKTETDSAYVEIQQTPKKSKLKAENKIHSSVLSKSANRLSLDLESKKKSSTTNFLRRSVSISHSPSVKVIPSPLISKRKSGSQLKEVKKRFPSDPGLINSASSKKGVTSDLDVVKICSTGKDTQTKSITALDTQKEKTTILGGTVKSKLRKKIDSEIVSKKGPMKAVLPIGSMQRRGDLESVGKKIIPFTGTITPPKSHKIISSTPNSTDKEYAVKKSPRSKPVASSTPDAQNSKARKVQSQLTNCSKKRNFSCDISPVTTHLNVSINNEIKESPKKINKLPSPKKTTPKRRPADSGIPKCRTPPMIKRTSSSFDVNQYERLNESPQRSLNRRSEPRKNSPIPLKKSENKIQQSPLRDSNKLSPKVKPFNLISKLRRHSNGTNIMEKENNYI